MARFGSLTVWSGSLRAWVGQRRISDQRVVRLLTCAGSIEGDDWVRQVAPEIESRMAQYEEGQIEFAIMSLVREPLADLVAALADNVKSINVLEQRLGQVKPDWEDYLSERRDGSNAASHETVAGPCEQYRLYAETIDQAQPSSELQARLKSDGVPELLTAREAYVAAQAGLRASIKDETKAFQTDNERAASRRNDQGLLAKGLLQVLDRMGKLKSLLESDGEVTSIASIVESGM
ncbi:MAG: hypothetical protein Q9216_000243 [Gyalolechia sp. 2 TL-2023]